jgi:hypothetical protein
MIDAMAKITTSNYALQPCNRSADVRPIPVLNMATQKPTHRKPVASAQPSLQSVVGETTYEV